MRQKLIDSDSPMISEKAKELLFGLDSEEDKLNRIVDYVRNEVLFGFPVKGDFVPASETLQTKMGQCNTKAALVAALLRAAGMTARIHFSLISKEIQRGFFTGLTYWILPKELSHSWVEAKIGSEWRSVDHFVNDQKLHEAATKELARRGWRTGFSISLAEGPTVLSARVPRFEQMGAVTKDHGVWDDPIDYYNSELYRNRPVSLDNWLYRRIIGRANQRIRDLRNKASSAPQIRSGAKRQPSEA